MKKKNMRLLALLLAAVLALSACGGGNKDDSSGGGETTPPVSTGTDTPGTTPAEPSEPAGTKAEPVKDFTTYQTAANEMETFLVFNNEGQATQDVLANCMAGLLEVTPKGTLQPAIATEWGTEDGGLTWTFKLRDDIVWVDVNGNEKAKTVAHDWLTGLEWVLNFHKNSGYNTSMPNQLVAGAEDYYNYTKELSEEEARALSADNGPFLEMVGIEAPDDYTLVYTCPNNAPYFETLCFGAALRPLSQAQVDEMGVSGIRSMDNTDMWYNGAYVITEYIQGNTTVLERNPSYWDKDCTLFDSVTYVTVEDNVRAQDLFMNGEVDWCNVTEATLQTIYEDPSDEWYPYLVEARPTPYSYQAHLNYAKNKEDGTPDDNWNNAVANEAFRLSLLYGLDLTKFWARTNFINPTGCENLTFTKRGLCYFSDGREYTTRVMELLDREIAKGEEGYVFLKLNSITDRQLIDKLAQASQAGVEVPEWLDKAILKGLAVQPEDRFQSAAEFLDAVENQIAVDVSGAAPAAEPAAAPKKKRNPVLLAAAALAVAAAVGAGMFLGGGTGGQPQNGALVMQGQQMPAVRDQSVQEPVPTVTLGGRSVPIDTKKINAEGRWTQEDCRTLST